jgi:hypothetical protein
MSVQIGGDSRNSINGNVDGIAMKYVVTNSNLNISFDVALRMVDFTFHKDWGAAYFWAAIIDNTGNIIDEINVDGSSAATADPFVLSTIAGLSNPCFCSPPSPATLAFYRPWRNQILSAPASQIGNEVALVITVGDCAPCGHSIVGYIDNVCRLDSLPPPIIKNSTTYCNQQVAQINFDYNIPADLDLSKLSFFCRIYKNGTVICAKYITPPAYTGNYQFQFTSTDCPTIATGCFDYNVFLVMQNTYGGYVAIESLNEADYLYHDPGPNNTHEGITPGKNNDVCCVATPPCPACSVSVTVYKPGGGNIVLSNGSAQFECNKTYDFGPARLTCSPTGAAISIKQVKIIDAAGNTPAWVSSFSTTGTGNLLIPNNISGNYYIKYVWGNSTADCDSIVYPITVVCPPVECTCEKSGCVFSKKFSVSDGTTITKYSCGSSLNFECNKKYTFNMSSACPTNTLCPPIVTAQVFSAAGTPVAQGPVPLNVTFTASGDYTIIFNLEVNGKSCAKCESRIKVGKCTSTACDSCNVKVSNTSIENIITNSTLSVSQLIQSFTFSNLPASITEVRASVSNITIAAIDNTGKQNEECLSCITNPVAWGSIVNGTGIPGITPLIYMGGATASAPVLSTIQNNQNPREIVWTANGNFFAVNDPVQLTFLLPAASTLSCCTRQATICVKFVFRDENCKECIVIKCFDVEIK